jgi:hypothetical protein
MSVLRDLAASERDKVNVDRTMFYVSAIYDLRIVAAEEATLQSWNTAHLSTKKRCGVMKISRRTKAIEILLSTMNLWRDASATFDVATYFLVVTDGLALSSFASTSIARSNRRVSSGFIPCSCI